MMGLELCLSSKTQTIGRTVSETRQFLTLGIFSEEPWCHFLVAGEKLPLHLEKVALR